MRSAVYPYLSIFSPVVKKTAQTLFFIAPLILLTACLPEEKEDTNPVSKEAEAVNQFILSLNGFWDGGFEQTDTLRVLIYNGVVYGIDADKAIYGSVVSPENEEVDFTLSSYPFAYSDETNLEFVSDRTSTSYSINGLLATNTLIVGDYETSKREYGSLTLINDETYNTSSSLDSLTGEWATEDLKLNITSSGKFHGVNNGNNKNCVFEGQINIINTSESIFSLELNRRTCDDFNGDSTGYAAINAEGELEFYSKMGSSLLFMTFTAPASTGNTTDPTEEETSAEQAP